MSTRSTSRRSLRKCGSRLEAAVAFVVLAGCGSSGTDPHPTVTGVWESSALADGTTYSLTLIEQADRSVRGSYATRAAAGVVGGTHHNPDVTLHLGATFTGTMSSDGRLIEGGLSVVFGNEPTQPLRLIRQ